MREASVYHEGVCAGAQVACGLREIVLNISVRLPSRQMDEGFSLDCVSHGVSGSPSTCSPASSLQNPLTIGKGLRLTPKDSGPQDKLVTLAIKEEGEEKGEGEEERKKSKQNPGLWPTRWLRGRSACRQA